MREDDALAHDLDDTDLDRGLEKRQWLAVGRPREQFDRRRRARGDDLERRTTIRGQRRKPIMNECREVSREGKRVGGT